MLHLLLLFIYSCQSYCNSIVRLKSKGCYFFFFFFVSYFSLFRHFMTNAINNQLVVTTTGKSYAK